MGFLTDVRGGQNVITDTLIKWHNVICCILYLGGIGLFLALAHDSLNNKTYFSENALLPGKLRYFHTLPFADIIGCRFGS